MRSRGLALTGVGLLSLTLLPAAWGANGNPTLDRTFSRDGVASLSLADSREVWSQVVPVSNGRVYALGSTSTRTSYRGLVAAYTNRGRLDSTFSGDGTFRMPKDHDTWLQDGVALPSGGLLVVGQNRRKALVFRLRSNGRVDQSFAGGYRFLPQSDVSRGFVQIATDSAGNAYTASDNIVGDKPFRSSIVVTKLSPAGGIVRSFGTRGQVYLKFARALEVTGLAVDSQDRPVVLSSIADRRGSPTSTATLIRLTTSGQRDTTFNSAGRADLRLPSEAAIWPVDLDVSPADDIVVGSKTPAATNTRFAVHRFLSSGVPDPSYSGDGISVVSTDRRLASYAESGALLADGSYAFATIGVDRDNYIRKAVLLRITPDGALDRTFGRNGLFIPDLARGWESVYQLAVDAQGRLLATGEAARASLLLRLKVTY